MNSAYGKVFDHAECWREAVGPLVAARPPEVAALVARVDPELPQDRECNVVWPDDGGALRRSFDAIEDDAVLAQSALVAWRAYMTMPRAAESINDLAAREARYSDLTDQVLRARLGLGHDVHASVRVLWGCLDVRVSDRDAEYAYVAVGLATRENLRAVQEDARRSRADLRAFRDRLVPKDGPLGYLFVEGRYDRDPAPEPPRPAPAPRGLYMAARAPVDTPDGRIVVLALLPLDDAAGAEAAGIVDGETVSLARVERP